MVPIESLKIIIKLMLIGFLASFLLFQKDSITENVKKYVHCIDTYQ